VSVVVAGGCRSGAGDVDVESYFDSEATFQTSFYEQYKTLVRRNLLRDRDRYLSRLHLGQLLFVAVFAGLVWFRTERTETTAEDRIGIVSITHNRRGREGRYVPGEYVEVNLSQLLFVAVLL